MSGYFNLLKLRLGDTEVSLPNSILLCRHFLINQQILIKYLLDVQLGHTDIK